MTLNTYKKPNLLKQHLAKFNNCPIETTPSTRNLGIIFDEYLTFSDQISSLSKSCYSHIRALRCIRPYILTSVSELPVLLPHLPFTLNLTTAIHYTSVYQILKYIDFNKSKILLLALLSNLPGSHISLLYNCLLYTSDAADE